ncbi:MAG TPA: hypothetical protein PLP67_05740 [Methylotenera sp.]|nr:hypothetical protein [Methylotenera sp.]HPM49353.1 hypothetical protein [Methylotenera sp.]
MQVSAAVNTSAKATQPTQVKANTPTKVPVTHQASQPEAAKENSLTRLLASCCDCV